MKLTFNKQNSLILIKKYIEFVEPIILEISSFKMNEFDNFLYQLLIRLNSTIKAAKAILVDFSDEKQMYLPLGLILRSINTDYLTILYLQTFIEYEVETQTACINEIKVLDKDYVKFLRKISIEELEFVEKYRPTWSSYNTRLKNTVDNHFLDYKDYYTESNGEFRLLTNEEIRISTKDAFFFEGKNKSNPLTEESKHERIKEKELAEYGTQAFLAFKFYSQYQHISPLFLKLDPSRQETINIIFFNFTIENLIFGTNMILIFIYKLNVPFKEGIKCLFDECQDIMNK